MKTLKTAMLLILCSLTLSSAAFAQSTLTGDGEYWPFPWGTECPFPWDSIQRDKWSFEFKNKTATARFYVEETNSKFMTLMTVILDENHRLIGFGKNKIRRQESTVSLDIDDLTSNSSFNVLIRLYYDSSKVSLYSNEVTNQDKGLYCTDLQNTFLALKVTSQCKAPLCHLMPTRYQIMKRMN